MSSWSGNGDDGGGAAPFRASPVRDSTDPAFWGIERHSASRILKDLAGASKPRPKPLDRAKKQPAWSPAPKPKGGVLDVSLTTSSMARNEAKEQINARFGLQYDPAEFASTSLRPVVPSGAITPAAQRILAPRSGRSHSSLSVHSAGGMLGMISVRRSKDNLPDRSWQAVFTEKQNFSQKQLASQSLDDVRQDRKSGLYIRAKSRAGTDLDVSHSNSRHGHSVNADHSLGGDHDATVLAGADEINTAIFEADIAALDRELQFPELVENLTNLSVIRQFVTKSIGESGVLSVLRIMNKSCTSLEEAARREANAPKATPAADETESGNLYYWLERLRQHRRFVLEESEALHRRPQAVLEKALLMQTTLPLVYKSASSLVRAAERKTQELMATLDTIKSSAKQSVGAATMLAGLKAEIRAMCLDGSMQTSHTQPVAAATFRVLIAEVGQRTIQVRKVMIEGGIAVDEATLLELLRRDEGLFPSAFDFGLARQAVLEAKSALEDLKNAIVRDREIETELRKKIKAAEEKLRREETELKKIEENEKQLEFEKKVEASKLNRVFAQAIQKVAWEGPCGGGNGSKLGGAVVLEGSHVYATADDNNIMVYDLDTTLFDFCKKYCLAGGHTQTVTCLAVIDGHTLFSGSMDHTICVWDVERDFAAEQILQGHTETVSCMAISDSNPGAAELEPRLLKGRFLCSGSYDMTIRIWEALLNEEHAEGKMTASIESGKGNPSVSRSGSPLQRKELRWQCARVLFGHGCFIHSIVTQGKFVYSAGEDGLIKKWDVTKRHSVGQLEGIEESVYALCLRREGAGVVRSTEMLHLLTSGIEYGITAWDLQDKSLLQDGICGIAEARVFKLTPDTAVDSARAEIVDMEHKIEMAVTEDGRMLLQQGLQQCRERLDGWLEWKNTLQYVNSLAYSKGFIYSGGGEDCVRVWSTDLSTCVGNVGGLQGVYAMSVDGDLLSVCTRDNRVHLLGTPERAEAYSKAVEERENKFRTDGGELWLFDLVNDSARMLLPGIRVRSVSCGQKHGLALDDHGRAYSWGVSARGQCGLGTKDDVKVPRRIENIEGAASISDSKVKEVSAGWFHSILLMTTGVCFACGENDLGQLGLPESKESEILYAEWQEAMQVQARAEGSEHKRLSDKIASISTAHSMANLVYTPRQVILGASQEQQGLMIVAVAAGGRHTVFMDESGAVWSSGLGTHGQLGVPREKQTRLPGNDGFFARLPQQMPRLDAVTVVGAAVSISHTLLLTQQGRVFACGSNDSGQLGVGDVSGMDDAEGNCLLLPHLTLSLRQTKITCIAAGMRHSMYLASGGEVFASGAKGPTGLAQGTNVPLKLPPCTLDGATPAAMRIVTASPGGPGGDYSFMATTNGHVFIAGPTPVAEAPPPQLTRVPFQKSAMKGEDGMSAAAEGSESNSALAGEQLQPEAGRSATIKSRVPVRVRPEYVSYNGAAWKLADVDQVGLLPVATMSRFGDEVQGVQGMHEIVSVVEASCVPFHPSRYARGITPHQDTGSRALSPATDVPRATTPE